MFNKIVFGSYLAKNKSKQFFNRLKTKISPKTSKKIPSKFGGKRLLNMVESNDLIYNMILSDKPFMVARYGTVEAGVMIQGIAKKNGFIKKIGDSHLKHLYTNAGFFPASNEDSEALKFVDLMLEKSKQVDLLGVMFFSMSDYLTAHALSPDSKATPLVNLEPWYSENPWTRALKGKKVLFIHPYEESILSQNEVRDKLFENKDILPEFELLTLKAVQTISDSTDERFSNWFEALQYMHDEAMKKDFDVAIIGCGAYGFPLAAMLKESGKKAIHLGGATQLFWGIKGARWDNHPILKNLYNEFWIRPQNSEKPKGSEKVEGGCYW